MDIPIYQAAVPGCIRALSNLDNILRHYGVEPGKGDYPGDIPLLSCRYSDA